VSQLGDAQRDEDLEAGLATVRAFLAARGARAQTPSTARVTLWSHASDTVADRAK
jgi:hypothetical protein